MSNTDYNVSYLSFDIYLPKYNVAIEYDGEQHFYPCDLFGGDIGFARTKERDRIKDDYCKNNTRKEKGKLYSCNSFFSCAFHTFFTAL